MEAGRIIIAGISFSVAGLGAAGDVVFTRPGPCAAQETYLLAGNSVALIRVEDGEEGVIVFRRQERQGWASKRLLERYDLRLDEAGTVIVNSGQFCRGTQ